MGQDAALEILAEILFDVSGYRVSGYRETLLIRKPTAGQPGFQMALYQLIHRAVLRPSAPISRCAGSILRLALSTRSRSHDPIRE